MYKEPGNFCKMNEKGSFQAQTRRSWAGSIRKIRASTLMPLIEDKGLEERKKSRYNSININSNL